MPASGTAARALAAFPNLKAIFSLGAGVDDLLADPELPDVPMVRIVDPDLTMRMTEYVVLHVLMHHRRQRLYDTQQRVRMWHDTRSRRRAKLRSASWGSACSAAARRACVARLGFRRRGLEPDPKIDPRHRDTSTAPAGSLPFLRAPKSWFACCRRRRQTRASSTSTLFSQAQARRRARRRLPDQCRARRAAGRCRHPRRARRRHLGRRHPRRVSDRAAAGRRARSGRTRR